MFRIKPTSLYLLTFFCLILLNSCNNTNPAEQQELASYLLDIQTWQEDRNREMRDTSSSWLNLVGLHWLEEGESTFGSDGSNTIILPNSAPRFAGTFTLENSAIILEVAAGVKIMHDGEPVEKMVIRHDMLDGATYLQMGSINFYAIKRPEGMAMRFKDSKNPDLLAFKDIPNFEIDTDMKIEAKLNWFETPQPIQIPTVLGSERTQKCPATLSFEINGEQYELYPYESYYGDPVWTIIFSDLTNGETSYGGGRFLSIEAPELGKPTVTLDFNKAYNPPCAFSRFATCPIPPPENRLAVAISAGEKMYGELH